VTDPIPFIAAALSGISARPIHDMAGPIDPKTQRPTIIPGSTAELVGKRAVEIGVAAAAAYDAWLNEQEEVATAPDKPGKGRKAA
jgi:hypothetical protein